MTKSMQFLALSIAIAAASACSVKVQNLADVQTRAVRFDRHFELPHFESSPAELDASYRRVTQNAQQALDRLARQDLSRTDFAATIGAFDDLSTINVFRQ